MQAGLAWLKTTFPGIHKKIKVLWQIDCFGSSSLTPLLFNDAQNSTESQYKYAVLNRIGDSAKSEMKHEKTMDFLW